ncbi:multidrug effflux MFS transporter [Pseudoruegeria sp. SK021]|uniref:multidrug effflux MFS transporter n=1 Tax=Pseudoruegeria sp. SK021 TaxID=1933035 RepID=UPI000A2667EB|nr:multidrug effflux MFS transporter [Pseudoruegeria sp. SK021]OSP55477.1 multidrug MFS transporter [Pseudoruegeria sp. SK021]
MFTPPQPSKPEFIGIMAMLMATLALSIDAMLPALPQIAAELTPDFPNKAQLVVTSFVLGMGLGTLVMGPLSDSFGRRSVLLGGAVVFCLGAILASQAQSLEMLLAARVLQGFGASASRVIAIAIVRDLYAGRQMAQMVSFVIIVFTLVPAIAPSLGAAILLVTSWRGIFVAFLIFSAVSVSWLMLRQPETLPPERRRPLRFGPVMSAAREVIAHPLVRRSILVQTFVLGTMFSTISSVQMIFDQSFGKADSFPLWFALIALCGSFGGFLNSQLVMRIGMRDVIMRTLIVQVALGVVYVGMSELHLWPEALLFPAFMVWGISVFAAVSLILGNLNAMALEPMGHIAGTASSIISAVSTVGAVLIAVPVGLMFDGTPLPVAVGVLVCSVLALLLMRTIRPVAESRARSA